MTLLYDSDNPDGIPDGVWAAGYVDGYAAPAWRVKGWSRFPNAKRIAVFASTNDGDVLDCERGDATPYQAPDWVKLRLAAGIQRPWVYCNRSNRAAVETALFAAGITPTQVALWVATLDGTQIVGPSPYGYQVVAVQFLNATMAAQQGLCSHCDVSNVSEVEMEPDERAAVLATDSNVKRIYDELLGGQKRLLTGVMLPLLQQIAAGGGAALTPAQAQQLQEIHDKIMRDLA